MSKLIALFAAASLILAAPFAHAAEPANLTVAKAAVAQYHDSGEYEQDIQSVIQQATSKLVDILRQRDPQKNYAIILDIDETALSNYASMIHLSFGGTLQEIIQDEDKGKDPVIKPTLTLFRYAKAHHIAIFFLTGRHEYERAVTVRNLKQAGYKDWDGLILRPTESKKTPVSDYKTAMRKQLVDKGYDIILNIGDQDSDLRGGYADNTYKVPNPFYLIP